MNKKLHIFFINLMFWGCSLGICANEKYPPTPNTRMADAPPVGLPLPIDDYIPHFVVIALIIGIGYLIIKERSTSTTT